MPVFKHRDDQFFAAPCEFHDPCTFKGPVTAKGSQIFADVIDASATGIALGVNDAAHTLNNYKKAGIFTPTIQDSSMSDAEGQTYVRQDGTFTEIGNRIFFDLHITMLSLGTLTGSQVAGIAGLPPAKVGSFAIFQMGQGVGLDLPGLFDMIGRMDADDQLIRLMIMSGTAGHSSLTIAQLSANGDIKLSGNYEKA